MVVERTGQDAVRRLRRESGLSQRMLASLAGTSGATVAAYETGEKEPRFSTLQRLGDSAGFEVTVRLAPADAGARARTRRERRSMALAAATAAAVGRDPKGARRLALGNLQRMARVAGTNSSASVLADWRRALDNGPAAVRQALLQPGEHGHDMRQMQPFAGLLSEDERAAALAVADAFDHLEEAS